MPRPEMVEYVGQKINGYAFIEYSIDGSNKKKREYFWANNLSVAYPCDSSGNLVIGQRPGDMNLNSASYRSGTNMYYPNYVGQCTWLCWGRAHERKVERLIFNGHNSGGQCYANINVSYSGVNKRSASLGPVINSICSCSGPNSHGHVILVELVDGNDIYYTWANIGGTDGVV